MLLMKKKIATRRKVWNNYLQVFIFDFEMKAKISNTQTELSSQSLIGKLKGAATTAKRRAFKHNLPVVIYENGKFFLVYRNKKKVESTPEEIEKLLAK